MTMGQVQQPLQDAHALDAACLDHRLGPAQTVRTEPTHLTQQPGGAAFDATNLGAADVLRVCAEATWFVTDVRGNLLELVVENADQPAVPTHPHLSSQVLRRHRVVGAADLDM